MPNAREIEIPEPEYTDLLNVTVTEKKRKLCADIIGGSTGGSNVRVKKETGKQWYYDINNIDAHIIYKISDYRYDLRLFQLIFTLYV